jgi:hypothetical protein
VSPTRRAPLLTAGMTEELLRRKRGEPHRIGTVLPHSYSADDTFHLLEGRHPSLLYGPATIRGNADQDGACVLVSEMETVTRMLAVTALDVCQRDPAGLRSTAS